MHKYCNNLKITRSWAAIAALILPLIIHGGHALSQEPNKSQECPGVFSSSWDNCFGRAGNDQFEYLGEFKNGKFEGKGKYTWANGTEYIGNFKDGKYSGHGHLIFSDGEEYFGDFLENAYDGYGTLILLNGEKYIGYFKNAKYHGQGILSFPNGDKYIGEFKENEFHGQGKLVKSDGSILEGIWKNDRFIYWRDKIVAKYFSEVTTIQFYIWKLNFIQPSSKGSLIENYMI